LSEKQSKWKNLAEMKFVTARQMILIMIILECFVQIPFIWIGSQLELSAFSGLWWMLQFFGLVMATNIGAVVLAIIAQDSANKIGASQSEAFSIDFMDGIDRLTRVLSVLSATAESNGESLDDQIDELVPEFYELGLAYLKTHRTPIVQPPNIKVAPPADYDSDKELFQ
jgi:hypothetical protein